MSRSQDNKYEDKNNLETGPEWAQFQLKPSVPARKHCCRS